MSFSLAKPIVVAVAATMLLAGCGSKSDSGGDVADLASVTNYHDLGDPPLGPASQTIAQDDGTSWSFSKPAQGKLTLLYFGYTSCPDVCPLTMSDLAVALKKLPADVSDKIWVQFVSTDPARDTAKRLSTWITRYSPAFHAGRAPIKDVITAGRAYGIAISAPKVKNGDIEVTHGAALVVLDSTGGEVGYFSELAGAKQYAAALPALVQKFDA